ncbi:MAG: rod shape-determining protein [Verrucomicrobia bacterium]|nr:rod shape-determining protein [Verrucomicrobiota bacterium]
MRTTYVPPLTAETAKEAARRAAAASPFADLATKPPKCDVLLVGFDFGTNTSCVKAAYLGANELLLSEIVPTVVGYARDGIVENLLPDNAKILFGQLAQRNRMYLRMVPPMANGVIADAAAAVDFCRYVRGLIQAPNEVETRAVVGLPANADRTARENLAKTLTGLFDKILLIPEPFLAALGFRDESKLSDPAYNDPVRNSLFVDIGAGTTDVCMVQGYFPTAESQVSVEFAGDRVDMLIMEAIRREYPDVNLSLAKVREIKERHSYVGRCESPAVANLVIGGKMRKLDFTAAIGDACKQLLEQVFDCVRTVVARASSDSVGELIQNIVLTGGGSCIRNLDTELQRLLAEDGYEKPGVQSIGAGHKELVAKGALVAGRQARENQWSLLA